MWLAKSLILVRKFSLNKKPTQKNKTLFITCECHKGRYYMGNRVGCMDISAENEKLNPFKKYFHTIYILCIENSTMTRYYILVSPYDVQ